jgi:hypothetical protein
MALTPDQTAMLQLLLERGQGYPQLAEMLGIAEADVRARARAALTEIAGADPDRSVSLTDYLLGQADPIGRADAVRHLRESSEDHELAERAVSELRAMFPDAALPRLPGEPREPRFRRRAARAAPAPPGEPAAGPLGFSSRQARLLAAVGAGALVMIVAVLAITGVFGGGDDEGAAETTTTAAEGDETIERVPLSAAGGGNAEGEAVFGLATGDQPFVDVALTGLDPAPQGQTYVVWLMLTPNRGYPIAPISVSEQGTFQDRFAIPTVALDLVARVQIVDISIADNRELARLIADAQERASQPDASVADLLLRKPGDTVLRGNVPRAGGGADSAG